MLETACVQDKIMDENSLIMEGSPLMGIEKNGVKNVKPRNSAS